MRCQREQTGKISLHSVPEAEESLMSLDELWNLLRDVRCLRYEAHSGAATGWNGVGTGVVIVSEPEAGVVVFEESGIWVSPSKTEMRFTNVFRWLRANETIRLEHLRFGPDRPVFLFDIAPDENGNWREVSPHQCRDDCYRASLAIEGRQLLVAWSIQGPRKQESIRYAYG
jgi:hypothetical protein